MDFMENIDNFANWIHAKLELFTLWSKGKTTRDIIKAIPM